MRPVLAVLKKNILSVICGVVALAAIIALFWPLSGYFDDLQKQVDARKTVFAQDTTLLHKQRTLPVLDPLSTDPEPLKGFPTPAVIARGTLAQTAIHTESAEMLDAATKLVTHQPLVPNALPNGSTMDATFFLRQYQQIMIYPTVDPTQMQDTLPVTILHAGMPPSDIDIKARQDQLKDQITQEKTQRDSTGAPINAPQVEQEVEDAVAAVPQFMREAVAKSSQMYIAPDAYHINPALTGVNPPNTVAMFNGQMGLWLLQDVFSALASANADSTGGVRTSPVKHLLKIEFADDQFKPAYSTDSSATPPPPADPLHPARILTMSPTGHVSNGLYDVVPFNLRMIVESEQVPAILEVLSKDRFITVLRLDMLTVDSGQAVLAGYLYGDKHVVQLNLSCEELFFRSDTLPYMPDSIRKALGIVPPPVPGAAAAQ
jgi:HSP20 family molecular chaperone IbpA